MDSIKYVLKGRGGEESFLATEPEFDAAYFPRIGGDVRLSGLKHRVIGYVIGYGERRGRTATVFVEATTPENDSSEEDASGEQEPQLSKAELQERGRRADLMIEKMRNFFAQMRKNSRK